MTSTHIVLTAVLFLAAMPAVRGDTIIFREIIGETDVAKLLSWGLRYKEGNGVARNIDRAIKLYCKAARDGHPEAQFQLGMIYAKGEGVGPDKTMAAAWLDRAAKQQHARAAEMLLMMGERGGGHAGCVLSDGRDLYPAPKRRYAGCRSGRECGPVRIGRHPAKGAVAQMVRELAPGYRLDPNLVLAVIEAESGFNPHALSPKNAQGLMQLIPATAERFGVRNVWDPEQNLRGGMAYLRWLMKAFDGDVRLVLAAYNAGEGAVERHGGIPPYAETRGYVERILRRLGN
jgi:TPR repeat protein